MLGFQCLLVQVVITVTSAHIGSLEQGFRPSKWKRSSLFQDDYNEMMQLGERSHKFRFRSEALGQRRKKSLHDFVPHNAKKITDCMTVSSMKSGLFYYVSGGDQEACGLYLVGRPDTKVRITLKHLHLDQDCDEEVVVFVDGWELNGSVFPSADDHPLPMSSRFQNICGGATTQQSFTSSQNAALVQFLIPFKGHGFVVDVEYIKNDDPCNVLMSDMTGLFQITNDGKARNCSLTTLLFPANFDLISVDVGEDAEKKTRVKRAGIIQHCSSFGGKDFVEMGGSSQLGSSLIASESICGYQPGPVEKGLTVMCGSSTVRLVSSGHYHNTVTVFVSIATAEDLDDNSNYVLACPDETS